MAIAADKKDSRDARRDDATDASRFFSRIGYVVLAVGAPVAVVLHPLGLYVMFTIGVGLILIAAALERSRAVPAGEAVVAAAARPVASA